MSSDLFAAGTVQIDVFEDTGADERGASASIAAQYLDFVGQPRDAHVASIVPGYTRGNHYHLERRELIIVVHHDRWTLSWDNGRDTEIVRRAFAGGGVVALAIPPNCAHAITNDGAELVWIIATTDRPCDPSRPDAHPRVVAHTE